MFIVNKHPESEMGMGCVVDNREKGRKRKTKYVKKFPRAKTKDKEKLNELLSFGLAWLKTHR
jgi:hypothetical protein